MNRIAVIGGGVAGLSAAAALSEAGCEVVLFEAEQALGYHASGRSAALFEENYGNETVRALNRATGPVLSEMGVLSPRGVMLVARQEERSGFQEDCSALGMTRLPVNEARHMVPILSQDIVAAALHRGASDVDTDAALQGFAKAARGHGARIVTGAKVEAIGPGFTLHAGGVAYEVDVVVNAAGAWADVVAGLAGARPLGLRPLRRSMARMPAPEGHDVRDWPMLLGVGESWYAKPDAGGWIVSPAEEEPVEPMDAWADDMVLAEGLARYEAHVKVPVTRVETSWAGLRTFAPDRTLVIGEDENLPGFFWLAGQGGYGFQTCAAAAAHLAALVTGRTPPLGPAVARALSPMRFRR